MASSSLRRLARVTRQMGRCPQHPAERLECNGGARWTGTDAEWEELEARFMRPVKPYTDQCERVSTHGYCACGRRLICRQCWREQAARITVPPDLAFHDADMPRFNELIDKIELGACSWGKQGRAHAL